MLKKNGGSFSAAKDWESHVVQDGLLITGQNPASSNKAARLLIEAVKNKGAR
jgi:putative intracellular protease/amidase